MKILLLAPHPFYQERGTPIAVDLMLRVFSAANHTVEVVTFHEGADRNYPGITFHRIPSPPWVRGVKPGFSFKKLICDAFLFIKGWDRVRRFRPDVIHAVEESVFMARLYGRMYRIPYVYDMDSCLSHQLTDQKPFLRKVRPVFRWFERTVICNARAVVPVCKSLADIAEVYHATNITLLPDIALVDDKTYEPAENLPDKATIRFMYIGNLEPYQGIELMLGAFAKAFTQAGDMSLVIVGGTDSHITEYRNRVQDLGMDDQVHLIGSRPINELGNYMAAADVLVSPRIQGENTPMKIYSYLASGKPVLATRLPTHTQVLSDSIAFLAEPSSKGFADAIVRLARDQELRKTLGQRGRAYVQTHHSFETYTETLTNLYRELDKE